jgi:hypothetical protein
MKKNKQNRIHLLGMILAGWFIIFGLVACTPLKPLPEVNLSDPGWTLWSGQAVWTPPSDRPPLAGDLIAARHRNNDILVNFSKPPFPIFTAQVAGKLWKIDFLERKRSYTGRGRPPQRFIWFRLPDLLSGVPAPPDWEVQKVADAQWSIVNQQTGESIRVVLDP